MSPDGVGQGRMGSMNASNPEKGIPYASSILGNNLPVAAGLALAKKLRADGGIVAVITGDGAMEEGSFYETLTFARTYDLAFNIRGHMDVQAAYGTCCTRIGTALLNPVESETPIFEHFFVDGSTHITTMIFKRLKGNLVNAIQLFLNQFH